MMEVGGEGDRREVRRPMNAFLIFCKRHRSIVREKNPDLDNRSVTRILGDLWASLKDDEKAVYTDLAKQYKDAFMKANPDYKWHNPEKVLGCQKSILPLGKPSNILNIPEGSITPGKLADPSNMGGLSLLLMAGEQSSSALKHSDSSKQQQIIPPSSLPAGQPLTLPKPSDSSNHQQIMPPSSLQPEQPLTAPKLFDTSNQQPMMLPSSLVGGLSGTTIVSSERSNQQLSRLPFDQVKGDQSVPTPNPTENLNQQQSMQPSGQVTNNQSVTTLTQSLNHPQSVQKPIPQSETGIQPQPNPPEVGNHWQSMKPLTENQSRDQRAKDQSLQSVNISQNLTSDAQKAAVRDIVWWNSVANNNSTLSTVLSMSTFTNIMSGKPNLNEGRKLQLPLETSQHLPVETSQQLTEETSHSEKKENLLTRKTESTKSDEAGNTGRKETNLTWNSVQQRRYSAEFQSTRKATENLLMSWKGISVTAVTPVDNTMCRPLLYQAVSAPKLAPRSLLAEAIRDTSDKTSYSDILKVNSVGVKVANFENKGLFYEGNTLKPELNIVTKTDGKENLTNTFIRAHEVKAENSKEFVVPGEMKEEEESPMMRCGKLVVNHIIDRLFSSELGGSTWRSNGNNSDEIDGLIQVKGEKKLDDIQEPKDLNINEDVTKSVLNNNGASVANKDVTDKMKVKVVKLKKKFLERMEMDKANASANTNVVAKVEIKKSRKRQISTGTDSTECESEETEDFAPVRKSRRRNRGQRYQELINEGIIQRSKERTAALQQSSPKEDSFEDDLPAVGPLNSYVLPETAIRRIRKRTTSESAKDKIFHPEDARRYKTGDFDLEAQIATLPACSVEKMGRKRGFGRQRHSSECIHTHHKLSESESVTPPNLATQESKTVSPPFAIKQSSSDESLQPVTGSRKRKARKHSITHMLPAPPTLVKNGKVKTDIDGLSPCLIKPPAELLPQQPDCRQNGSMTSCISNTEESLTKTVTSQSAICLECDRQVIDAETKAQNYLKDSESPGGSLKKSSDSSFGDRKSEIEFETGSPGKLSPNDESHIKVDTQSRNAEKNQPNAFVSERLEENPSVQKEKFSNNKIADIHEASDKCQYQGLTESVPRLQKEECKSVYPVSESEQYSVLCKDQSVDVLVKGGKDVNSNTTVNS